VANIHGVIPGKTIELKRESGLPEGQRVAVEVSPLDERPACLERFGLDPTVMPGKFVIKGFRCLDPGHMIFASSMVSAPSRFFLELFFRPLAISQKKFTSILAPARGRPTCQNGKTA
jgi:hypothetical protein